MLTALQFPQAPDELLQEAIKRLGHPVQAQIDVYKPKGYSDANALAYRPGDLYMRNLPPTDVNMIRINANNPSYKKKDITKMAGLLAHEERHLAPDGGEPQAYQTQIETLTRLGEPDKNYMDRVRQALLKANSGNK